MEEENVMSSPHIAIMPGPGMGHIIPFGELAKLLALRHNFSVTFVTISAGPPSAAQKNYVDTLPKIINSVQLPPVLNLPSDDSTRIETLIALTVIRSLPSLQQLFETLGDEERPVTTLVVDLFGTDAFDVAKKFNVEPYLFYTSNAMSLSVFLRLPELDQTISGEYRDHNEVIRLPGCVPLYGKDLPDAVQDRKNEVYELVLHICRRYKEAKAILLNSFVELEPRGIESLRNPVWEFPPVYPIGPLIQTSGWKSNDSDYLKWLDEQPVGSVLFVSFGSGGTLSPEQLKELALGLEMSKQRFLWVVRSPSVKDGGAHFFDSNSMEDPFSFLPEGFLERTREVGLLVPSWVSQIQVLSHGSVGGFMTHCGWNSTLESLLNGVPLIAWPLYAEQRINAPILAQEINVALWPKRDNRGIVDRTEIAKVVKELLEGEEGKKVRQRVREVKEFGSKTFEENGTSYNALSEVASAWRKSNKV